MNKVTLIALATLGGAFVWFELVLGYVALKEMYAGIQRKLEKVEVDA